MLLPLEFVLFGLPLFVFMVLPTSYEFCVFFVLKLVMVPYEIMYSGG